MGRVRSGPIQRGGLEPQTWTRPPREAPRSVPGVSVLRTLGGLAAGVQALDKSMPQKLPCEELSGGPVFRTLRFHYSGPRLTPG